ncbi:MAG: hypothetical protein AB7F86_01380 [Bdellovibrionales bacterium]
MSKDKISDHLWNQAVLAKFAGKADCQATILEQYKLYVEMADKISARRDVANAFFLSINGAVLSAGPAIIEKGISFRQPYLLFFPYFVLCLELFLWWRLIISYKQLNGAKFKIIGVLEEKLPARPYGKTEWELLLKSGTDRRVYWPLTHIELSLPWLFFVGYTVALFSMIFST